MVVITKICNAAVVVPVIIIVVGGGASGVVNGFDGATIR